MAFKKGDKKPENSGKKKGTINKVTATLKEMILASLDEAGGQAYLLEQARLNPSAYMTLIGKVLPTTLASDKENPIISAPMFQLIVTGGKETS